MIAQLLNSNTNLSDELLNVLEDLRRDIRVALDPSTDKSKIEIQDNSSHDRDEEKADWFTSKEYLDTIKELEKRKKHLQANLEFRLKPKGVND